MTDGSGIVLSRRASVVPVYVRMHYESAHTYTQEQMMTQEFLSLIGQPEGQTVEYKSAKGDHWEIIVTEG